VETLRDGVAVITGAGSGIGEALALKAAAAGMKVVLADIDVRRIDRVATAIEARGGAALAIQTDVADPTALERLAAQTHAAFGDVRLLVNNAGVETMGLVWDIPADLWERTFKINVLGVVSGVRAFPAHAGARTTRLHRQCRLGRRPVDLPGRDALYLQ